MAIKAQPYRDKLLVERELNANLEEPEGTPRGESIADKLAAAGLLDMGIHFLLRHMPLFQDSCTWIMKRDGQEVRSRKYYILRTDHRLFQGVAVWDLQHNSYHYMVLGCLRGDPAKDLTVYLPEA